jgi:hypothetical protein
MMKIVSLSLAAVAVMAMPSRAGDAPTDPKVVAFSASVRVDVDAAGKPVKVEAPADLPEAIRGYIEKRVASWQYLPAKIEGVPQAATTYVEVNACAVPVADGYRLGLDFDGNGMRRAGDQRFKPPVYPAKAEINGIEAEIVLILDVRADGTARIKEVEKLEYSGRPVKEGRMAFRPELERWVKSIRFDPELVAGKPVTGKVRMPVTFSLRDGRDAKMLREELQAKSKVSRECQIAAGEDPSKPVAMSPVVTVTPAPAS